MLSKLVLSKLVLSKLVTKMQQCNCYHLIRKEAMARGQRPLGARRARKLRWQ